MLKKILAKLRERNQKFNEASEDVSVQKKLNKMSKTNEERELEEYMEAERQVQIKARLKQFRERDKKQILRGNFIFGAKNMFANNKNIFVDDDNILKSPNIFTHQRNIFQGQRSIFIQ